MDAIREMNRQHIRAIGKAGLWAIFGLFGSQIIALLLYSPIVPLFGPFPPTLESAILTFCSGIGLVIIAGLYLRVNGFNFGYIDIRMLSLRDLGMTLLGVFVLMAGIMAISFILTILGVESAQHGIMDRASENNNPELLLAFIPLSLLVIGPTEELVFRNVVQKSLYERFDRQYAVVIAGVLFALVHFPAYLTSTLQAATSSVFVILVLSLILGEWYRRTENLTVTILVHGIFNALQFSLAYVQVRYDLAEATLHLLV